MKLVQNIHLSIRREMKSFRKKMMKKLLQNELVKKRNNLKFRNCLRTHRTGRRSKLLKRETRNERLIKREMPRNIVYE